jgi:hypothetical protein
LYQRNQFLVSNSLTQKKQTMKKITFTVLAIAAFGIASAQDMKFGIKGGIDMVSAKSTYGSTNASGFYFLERPKR